MTMQPQFQHTDRFDRAAQVAARSESPRALFITALFGSVVHVRVKAKFHYAS